VFALCTECAASCMQSDQNSFRIRNIDISGVSASVTTVAGSGTAAYADGLGTVASFVNPSTVTSDALMGNAYVVSLLISPSNAPFIVQAPVVALCTRSSPVDSTYLRVVG
jgi:hypothetical protein